MKLPDKESITGMTKKIGEAVKVPSSSSSSQSASGISDAERAMIEAEARKKYEAELKAKEDAERAKKYAEIEAKEKAEKDRLLEEKKKEEERKLAEKKAQEERQRVEAEQRAENERQERERAKWAAEEAAKQKDEDAKRALIEKELLLKQKEEAKAAKAAKKGKSHVIRNIGILIVILLAIVGCAYVSLITGNDNLAAYGLPLSYQANYEVFLPDNTPCTFLTIPITALSSGNSVTLMVNEERKTLDLSQTETFMTRHLTIKTLGIKVLDTDYQITATYRGVVANKDNFLFVVKTSSPIPSWLMNLLCTGGIAVRAA